MIARQSNLSKRWKKRDALSVCRHHTHHIMSSTHDFRPRKKRYKPTWEHSLRELREFYNKHGHSNVPAKVPHLGMWCVNQRKKRNELSQPQKEQLDDFNFNWETQDERFERQWNEMFLQFKAHRRRMGGSMADRGYFSDDKQLKGWVSNQQTVYREGRMKADRKEKLEQAGFLWVRDERYAGEKETTAHQEKWDLMCEKLAQFKDTHGHCMVSETHVSQGEADTRLLKWVLRQRVTRRQGTLKEDRLETLNKLGFVWDIDLYDKESSLKQCRWDSMLDRLVAFRDQHGHMSLRCFGF